MPNQHPPATLLPLSMRAATLRFETDTPGWTLAKPRWHATEPRSFRTRVTFDTPFSSVPIVHVGLSGFDIDNGDTARLDVRAVEISPEGFDLLLTTWLYTRVYQVSVSWLALGH